MPVNSKADHNTLILFLIFNRPNTIRQIFEAIPQSGLSRLYIAADGPRASQAKSNGAQNSLTSPRQSIIRAKSKQCIGTKI